MMSDRNADKIQAWLKLKRIKQVRIATDLQVSQSMVSRFIRAQSQSQKIFEYFIERGCPREYFAGRPEARRAA